LTGFLPTAVKVVQAMARVCVGAEKHRSTTISSHRLETSFEYVDEAIAMAAMYTANHLGVKAIVALTESGSTTLWMSRIRSGIPVFALTRNETTRRKVTLYRGVYPIPFDPVRPDPDKLEEDILEEMRRYRAVGPGDRVIFTRGELQGVAGGTNTMKIISA
ncbi:MAG: pyruvate kinase alpha/beta domain-containing protein, partial [Pseudomonadota bacterium]